MGTTAEASRYLGSISGIAFTLGVGVSLLTGGAVAAAETGTSSDSSSSAASPAPATDRSSPADVVRPDRESRRAPVTRGREKAREAEEEVWSTRAAERFEGAASVPDIEPGTTRRGTPVRDAPEPAAAGRDKAASAAAETVNFAGNPVPLSVVAAAAAEPAAQPDGAITIDSVDTVAARGMVTGVINATSARALPLTITIAGAPTEGGKASVGPTGQFTLIPTPAAVAAGATETFAVRITEKSALELFLEKLPFLGSLVPQIFMGLRQTPIVGDALAPLIGSTVVRRIDIDVSGVTPRDPVTLPAKAATGWNIYSWQATDATVVNAIDRQQPGLVRWFVEMDRFLEDETQPLRPPRPWSWNADTSFDPFFQTLAENDTTLVIALWNKDGWAKSMRACDICAWPDVSKYDEFVSELEAEAQRWGVTAIVEAQNEPDLRWGSLSAATNIGATVNFTEQWFNGLPQGFAKYSGGTGFVWQRMHQVIESPLASGGIISLYNAEITPLQRLLGNYPTTSVSTAWIEATAPLVDYTSFHRYGLSGASVVEDYVDWVYDQWSIWTQNMNRPAPFYIGEIGPSSDVNAGMSNEDAAKMRAIHLALATDPRLKDHYLGMTAHVFSSTGGPNPWDNTKGWWDPDFETTDVIAASET